MTLLDKGIALQGGDLHEPDAWQQVLRLGPVVDLDTGKEIIDVTAELCAELAAAHAKVVGAGIKVPIDYNHGTARAGGAESQRTYGLVTEMEARADGLYAKLALNKGGVKWAEDNKGNALTSPDIRGRLFHPERKAEVLADVHVRALSLTNMPRQNRLPEVQLSRDADQPQVLLASFADDLAVRRFEESLRRAAYAVLASEGYAAPEYLGVRAWQGDEAGTVVVSWWGETGGDHMRQMQWARSADGAVTCSGPSAAMQAITVYEPISPAASAAQLSRATGPKEVPMPGSTNAPFAALLARVPDDARADVAKALEAEAAAKVAAEAKVVDLGVQLSAAVAKAEGEGKVAATLLARVEVLEKDAADKAKAEQAKARAEFLLSGTKIGKVGADKDDQEFWGRQFDANPENAVALLSRIPVGTKGPVHLARAPGLAGVGAEAEDPEIRGARLDAEARKIQQQALAAGQNLSFQAAYEQAEKGGGR